MPPRERRLPGRAGKLTTRDYTLYPSTDKRLLADYHLTCNGHAFGYQFSPAVRRQASSEKAWLITLHRAPRARPGRRASAASDASKDGLRDRVPRGNRAHWSRRDNSSQQSLLPLDRGKVAETHLIMSLSMRFTSRHTVQAGYEAPQLLTQKRKTITVHKRVVAITEVPSTVVNPFGAPVSIPRAMAQAPRGGPARGTGRSAAIPKGSPGPSVTPGCSWWCAPRQGFRGRRNPGRVPATLRRAQGWGLSAAEWRSPLSVPPQGPQLSPAGRRSFLPSSSGAFKFSPRLAEARGRGAEGGTAACPKLALLGFAGEAANVTSGAVPEWSVP
ncbi:hypothetical protein HPB51_022957 [Rhipicephalus microplus]|uniref:Uncharacterized protein n=1 Tax=Rhipicephalus microplus TaxID=6941 RepID=A0A9J6EIM7_RHIMP|nr:hypothetical protein HPB51_022957 [Rhipicephalus microplus]